MPSDDDQDNKKYGKLRLHQKLGLKIAREIIAGLFTKKVIVASVTPGGGKTLLASIISNELTDADVIDYTVVIVPREALRGQMLDGFHVPGRGLRRRLAEIRGKSNSETLFPTAGIVTTYQWAAKHTKALLKKLKDKRVLLVLDEPHHLAEGEIDEECTAWKRAIDPLVLKATKVLMMSGTLSRHDGRRIPYLSYDEETRKVRADGVDIAYTRREALEERAIRRMRAMLLDGRAEYEHLRTKHSVNLSEAPSKEQARALRTVLEDAGYRDWACLEALREWKAYREMVWAKAKAIVVCHNQKTAEHMARLIARDLKVEVALAIDNADRPHRAIQRFRDGTEGDVLVTVGMAYEGLDVPEATHLVCLTNIRSRPWLEQVVNRVTRVCHSCDLEWHEQIAFVYVPDDPLMRAFIETIMVEQPASFTPGAGARERKPPVMAPSTFKPLDATPGDLSFADEDGSLSREESELVARVKEEFPETASGWSIRRLLAIGHRLYRKSGT